MQIHQIKTKKTAKTRKRVGRGGKRGTYSGHGGKGQTSRAGRNFRPIIREILKRYPKLRGYKNRPVSQRDLVVDIGVLAAKFEAGAKVSPRILVERKILARVCGKYPLVKILADGDIAKALNIEGCSVSKAAREKIVKAGGKIK